MKNLTNTLKVLCGTFIFIFSLQTQAQDDHNASCGTIVTPENEAYYKSIEDQIKQYEAEYFEKLQNRTSTALTSVPIKAHVIRTTAGTGGLTVGQLDAAIANMNAYYADAFMEFFLCDGINYIDDTSLYDFATNQEGAMTSANNVSGLINIYFANTVTSSSSGSGLCGYAYLPGGPDVILMANSCATNGSTLPHEVGHFFSLRHTHGPSNSTLTTELVDGSNCDTDGDLICDTAADPQLGSGNVTAACVYTGTATDANGQAFVPDPTNIMSYSRKACRTFMSTQQMARIYATYQTVRNNFACPSFNVDVAANFTRDCSDNLDVSFTDNSTGATSWQWDVDGDDVIDYTTQNPMHSYTPGSYDVALTISNGSESITKVYADLIDFETELVTTTQVHLTLNTDNWPAETRWEFRDGITGTVLNSFGPYSEPADDFTTFNYSFDVVLGNCYEFEIFDSYGDGICCASGIGSYELKTDDDTVIVSGGAIGFGENTFMSNETLSLNDYFEGENLSIYPNPTSDILNIKLRNQNLPDSITITNMLGQIVLTQKVNQINDLAISTNQLNNGMYFVKVIKDNQSKSLPFIKM
jgi:hypothetical protein